MLVVQGQLRYQLEHLSNACRALEHNLVAEHSDEHTLKRARKTQEQEKHKEVQVKRYPVQKHEDEYHHHLAIETVR